MTDWEKRDQGNDNKVRGMAVGVREEFGIGEIENCEAKTTDWSSTWMASNDFSSNDGLPSAYYTLELSLILKLLYFYPLSI